MTDAETINQLRAELEKWKLGCETNADCYRTAIRAQDEQRLELIKLRAELNLLAETHQRADQLVIERTLEASKLRAERDEIENRTDEQWLNAIAANSKTVLGKEWETRDGESPQEGRQANISAIFSEIDTFRAELDELKKQLKDESYYGMCKDDTATVFMNQVKRLQTHNAALLAVARAARNHRSCGENCEIRKALAALGPLGIKV